MEGLKADKMRSAQELKEYFIAEASPLLDQYLDATFGRGSLKSSDSTCRKEIWELLKGFLEKADEKIILEEKYRGGSEGVLSAIQDGVLTLEEGERLIEIHAKIKNMNKVDGPLQLGAMPSLTINTTTVALPEPQEKLPNLTINPPEEKE